MRLFENPKITNFRLFQEVLFFVSTFVLLNDFFFFFRPAEWYSTVLAFNSHRSSEIEESVNHA